MGIPATPAARTTSVLLVDDQPIIGEAVRRMLAGEEGIAFHYCKDAPAALEKAAEVGPTVILQDLVMPGIDGLELVRRYRADERFHDVPVIVLSTKEEPAVKAEAFALGANDYIVKLPDRLELVARVKHHSRGYIALAERNEAFTALQKSQQVLANDIATASTYVRSLLPPPQDAGGIVADWRFIPSASLGGDAFGYHDLDPEHFAIYLIDVCGHGVGAALLSVSALTAIRSETLPQTDFRGRGAGKHADYLQAAGRTRPQGDADHRPSRRLRWAGGGHPPAILWEGGVSGEKSGETDGRQMLDSEGPLIGAVEGLEFTADEVDVPLGSRLFLYSDGAFEISRPDGSMWEFEEFLGTLAAGRGAAGGAMEGLLGRIREVSGREDFHDDFSMIELVFG